MSLSKKPAPVTPNAAGPGNVPQRQAEAKEDAAKIETVEKAESPIKFLDGKKVVFEHDNSPMSHPPGGDYAAKIGTSLIARGNSFEEALAKLEARVGQKATASAPK